MLVLIAMVDRNFAIASNGRQPIHLHDDMCRFRMMTVGSTVIYGRKTFEDLPFKKPLTNRENVLLTTGHDYDDVEGLVVYHNISDILHDYQDRMCYVIGGGSVYLQFLPFCDSADITMVNTEFQSPTAYFPDLRLMDEWRLHKEVTNIRDYDADTDIEYGVTRFTYINKERILYGRS